MDARKLRDDMRNTARGLWVGLLIMLLTSQPSAAQAGTLTHNVPVTGTISAGGAAEWQFTAQNGEMLSLVVEPEDDSLDPILTIRDSSGAILISNDDYAPPETTALLQAITIPRSGSYIASVSGFGNSAGAYRLLLLPGYAEAAFHDDFSSTRGWEPESEAMTAAIRSDSLALTLTGINAQSVAHSEQVPELTDYFAEVRVRGTAGNGGWLVGMTLRHVGDNYYLYQISDQGLWRVILHTANGETTLRDWSSHPAIVAGTTEFLLGALVNGPRLEFFYNGALIGAETDTTLTEGGRTGLALATLNVLDGETRAQFDDFLITVPRETEQPAPIPDQLIGTTPNNTAQELERRRIIPAGGTMAFIIETSFAEYANDGVTRFTLARENTFTDFALGTTVTWRSAAAGITGCGLVLRDTGSTEYTLAFVDQTGGYGLSRRIGEIFEPGLFGEGLTGGTGPYTLLVIAQGEQLLYYANGDYMGRLENPAVAGTVGIAVVNYEAINTSCNFRNTWLWRWN